MTVLVSIDLVTVECGECGGVYGIQSRYHRQKRENGGYWNCPYCRCSWGFAKDGSEMAKLKRKLEYMEADKDRVQRSLDRERSDHATTESRRRAEKAAKTRLKNRVSKGVCPCCNRHFENLAKHMASKHPDFTKTD